MMKLQTKLQIVNRRPSLIGQGWMRGPTTTPSHPEFHDTLAAHALLQAMDDIIEKWGESAMASPGTCKMLIIERADKLLASWLDHE